MAAGQALDRDLGHAVRDLDAVARGPDVRGRGVHPLVHDDAAGRADLDPGRGGQRRCWLPSWCRRRPGRTGCPRRRSAPRAPCPCAGEAGQRGVEVQRGALFPPGVLHRRDDVRVGGHGQRPGARVDQVRLDAAMTQRGDHLQAQRGGLDHDRGLHPVQDLVPLDRPADVLDVVQVAQVGAGYPGVGVVEAGGDDQLVVADLALALHRHGLRAGIEPGDPRLIVDVDARVVVGLPGRQEQALEVGYLPAVHVGNAARAVADVLELGVDPDLGGSVSALGRPGRADARGAATDHHDPLRHQ